jgi:uncharacterized coiled-coil protein SlyX
LHNGSRLSKLPQLPPEARGGIAIRTQADWAAAANQVLSVAVQIANAHSVKEIREAVMDMAVAKDTQGAVVVELLFEMQRCQESLRALYTKLRDTVPQMPPPAPADESAPEDSPHA